MLVALHRQHGQCQVLSVALHRPHGRCHDSVSSLTQATWAVPNVRILTQTTREVPRQWQQPYTGYMGSARSVSVYSKQQCHTSTLCLSDRATSGVWQSAVCLPCPGLYQTTCVHCLPSPSSQSLPPAHCAPASPPADTSRSVVNHNWKRWKQVCCLHFLHNFSILLEASFGSWLWNSLDLSHSEKYQLQKDNSCHISKYKQLKLKKKKGGGSKYFLTLCSQKLQQLSEMLLYTHTHTHTSTISENKVVKSFTIPLMPVDWCNAEGLQKDRHIAKLTLLATRVILRRTLRGGMKHVQHAVQYITMPS